MRFLSSLKSKGPVSCNVVKLVSKGRINLLTHLLTFFSLFTCTNSEDNLFLEGILLLETN